MTYAPTDPEGVTGQMAQWLADLTLDQIPEVARERARYLILDGIACGLVGAHLPWSERAAKILLETDGSGGGNAATVWGWGRTAPPATAALLNGTFVQAFELDDYHGLAPLHSNALVLPALMSAVEQCDTVTGAQFLVAAIAGYEVGPRVGLALHGLEMLSRGWHSGAVFGTHPAAAAAGKIFGLNAGQFEDALGIAGTQSGGLMAAQFGSMVKRMHHGFSARNGFYAAALARGGYTGIKRVFESEYGGFLSTFGEGHDPDPSQVSKGLGELWECTRISVKPYAAMGGHHAAIAGILSLRNDHDLDAEQIEKVDIYLGRAAFHHGWWDVQRPLTETGAQMFVGYSVAVAILDGVALMAQYGPDRIDADDVWEMIAKIDAHHDPKIDSLPKENRLHTRLEVGLKDGRELSVEVPYPPGSIGAPLTNAAVVEKYHSLVQGVLEPARASAILDSVLSLEDLDDVARLVELLAGPVHSPF